MSTPEAGAAAPPPGKAMPKWQRWLTMAFGLIMLALGLVRLVTYFATAGDLPACDSRRAKDTLSNVFKEKDLHPTAYGEIKTLSSSKDLVECQATLPAEDKALDVDYKFVRNGDDQQIQYSIKSRPN